MFSFRVISDAGEPIAVIARALVIEEAGSGSKVGGAVDGANFATINHLGYLKGEWIIGSVGSTLG